MTKKVRQVNASVLQFTKSIDGLEESQKKFSEAVGEFGVFVKQPVSEPYTNPELDRVLEDSSKLSDECGALVAKLSSSVKA